jgi:phospholipase D1/2
VFGLRLLPIAPFSIVSLAAGLADVGVRDYLLATIIGQIPLALVVSYFAGTLLHLGHAGRHAVFLRLAIAGVLVLGLAAATAIGRRRYRREPTD